MVGVVVVRVGWGGKKRYWHVQTSVMLHSYPYIRHATLLYLYVMLRCCRFSCTARHTSCYAAVGFLALTSCYDTVVFSCASTHTSCYAAVASLAFHTYVVLSCCRFSCASTHTSCYAAVGSLALPRIPHASCCRFSCISTCTSCCAAVASLALPHIPHATLL